MLLVTAQLSSSLALPRTLPSSSLRSGSAQHQNQRLFILRRAFNGGQLGGCRNTRQSFGRSTPGVIAEWSPVAGVAQRFARRRRRHYKPHSCRAAPVQRSLPGASTTPEFPSIDMPQPKHLSPRQTQDETWLRGQAVHFLPGDSARPATREYCGPLQGLLGAQLEIAQAEADAMVQRIQGEEFGMGSRSWSSSD
jgi:hypothetical protein